MFKALTELYKELNPDILAGINEHIQTCYDIDLDVFGVIANYCNVHPDNAGIIRECSRLKDTDSISDLESFYDLIDFLMEVQK